MNEETNESMNNAGGDGETGEVKTTSEVVTQSANNPPSTEAAKLAKKKKKSARKTEVAPSATESVQFVGKQMRWNKKANKQEKVLRESPAFIIDGPEKIMLPADLHKGAAVDADTAARVKTLFPEDFKTPTAK